MKFASRVYSISCMVLCLAWMAKLQFVFGGDYLFRLASIGILLSLAVSIYLTKNLLVPIIRRIFIVNLITLIVAYCGVMLKVSHLMETQFGKDFLLDLIAYPTLFFTILYTFAHLDDLLQQDRPIKLRFLKTILLPWCVLIISLILYAVYSAAISHVMN
jgi:hypothetical protein